MWSSPSCALHGVVGAHLVYNKKKHMVIKKDTFISTQHTHIQDMLQCQSINFEGERLNTNSTLRDESWIFEEERLKTNSSLRDEYSIGIAHTILIHILIHIW